MVNIRNPREYCENFLQIIDKKQALVPLRFKPAQALLYGVIREEHAKGKGVRIVVLKGRQLGCSTMIEGIFFADSAVTTNASTLIIAHEDDATKHLFDMNKLFYDNLPEPLRPMRKASNAQELLFENPTKDPREKARNPGLRSRIRCITAGGTGGGRSFTFRNVHGSECAFWPHFLSTHIALMAAVPKTADSCVIYETTANGLGEFKDFWDDARAGRNDFRAVFLPWYLDPEYARPVEPGTEWTERERELMERLGLTPEQMAWRRWTIRTDCAGDEAFFRQEYPTFPEEAFLTTGRPFFDNERVMLLAGTAEAPEHTGLFEYRETESGKPEAPAWREDPRGFLRIWQTPEPGVPYVIGADSAGDGTDRFTMHVLDNTTGAQVAEYENPVSEILFARQLWCLGTYYNDALIALETNYGSYAELMLEQWGYPALYQRQRWDEIRKAYAEAYGFRTDTRTRPLILANLRTVMAEAPESVRSRQTLEQMLRFQYDRDGKPQAVAGEHDDLVMAAAIAHFARNQQRSTVRETAEPTREKLAQKWKREKGTRRMR